MIYEVSEKGYTNILKKKSKHRNTGTKKEQTSFKSALLKKWFNRNLFLYHHTPVNGKAKRKISIFYPAVISCQLVNG